MSTSRKQCSIKVGTTPRSARSAAGEYAGVESINMRHVRRRDPLLCNAIIAQGNWGLFVHS